jgi:hypothetical protein
VEPGAGITTIAWESGDRAFSAAASGSTAASIAALLV